MLKDKSRKINYGYNKQLRDTHRDIKYDIKTIKHGGESKKCRTFRMCLNLNDYQCVCIYIYIYIYIHTYTHTPHGNLKPKTFNRYTEIKDKRT